MKITFLVYRYWPVVGGVEKYVHELGKALLSKGHDVTVVAGATRDGLPAGEVHEGVEIHRFPAMRSALRMRCWFISHVHLFRRADVVHVSNTHMLETLWRMVGPLLDRNKVFLTRHGMSYVHPVPASEKRRAVRSLELAHGVVHDGEFIEKWLGVKPHICPNQGLSPSAEELPVVEEPPPDSAVFIGRLEPDSGIRIYIDAIDLLTRQGRPMKLDVYGGGSLRETLQHDAARRGLPVEFHGPTEGAQRFLQAGCFAFLDGRMTIQEAMARRRLVFAAYVDPLKRDYVSTEPFGRYLIAAGSATELAERVAHYCDHREERRALVDQAFQHARTLTWSATADAYLSLWADRLRAATGKPARVDLVRAMITLNREAQLPKDRWAVQT